MSRKIGLGALVIAMAAVVMPPASAAQSYTIAGGVDAALSTTGSAFSASGCNAAVATSPLNGVDARIIDISSIPANSVLPLRWVSGTTTVASALIADFYTAGCHKRSAVGMLSPGAWPVVVPPGQKWLVVSSNRVVNAVFTVG